MLRLVLILTLAMSVWLPRNAAAVVVSADSIAEELLAKASAAYKDGDRELFQSIFSENFSDRNTGDLNFETSSTFFELSAFYSIFSQMLANPNVLNGPEIIFDWIVEHLPARAFTVEKENCKFHNEVLISCEFEFSFIGTDGDDWFVFTNTDQQAILFEAGQWRVVGEMPTAADLGETELVKDLEELSVGLEEMLDEAIESNLSADLAETVLVTVVDENSAPITDVTLSDLDRGTVVTTDEFGQARITKTSLLQLNTRSVELSAPCGVTCSVSVAVFVYGDIGTEFSIQINQTPELFAPIEREYLVEERIEGLDVSLYSDEEIFDVFPEVSAEEGFWSIYFAQASVKEVSGSMTMHSEDDGVVYIDKEYVIDTFAGISEWDLAMLDPLDDWMYQERQLEFSNGIITLKHAR